MSTRLSHLLALLPAACLLLAQQAPPDSSPIFSAETKLVLTTFNVVRGAYFAPDVKKDDIVLLQDGKPRNFTIFEGPESGNRPPLELVLLFDTTTLPPPESKIQVKYTHWDRKATYDFTSHWSDRESRSILEKGGADVRVSVYRYDRDRLQRLCRSANDPRALTTAIQRLPEPMPAEESVPLTLPKGRMTFADLIMKQTGIKPDPKHPVLARTLGWTLEAAIDTLKDSTAAPSNAMRVLIMFSEVVGPTTTTPQDVADQAIALGIPVYPVVLDFDEYVRHPFATGGKPHGGVVEGSVPITRPDSVPKYDPSAPDHSFAAIRDLTALDTVPMVRFGSVGPLTGVESLYPTRLDANVVDDILNVIRDKNLSQYVVGFAPPSSGQQRKHSLEIKLDSKSTGKLAGGKRTAVY